MTAGLMMSAIVRNALDLNGIDLNAIARISAVQIVDCLVEGTLIAMFAGLVLTMVRRQNSGTRFAVWFSALMAIAVLPFLGGGFWAHTGGVPTVGSRPAITLPGSWAVYLFAAWAAIAAWRLAGVGRGLWHLYVLRKSCVPVDSTALDARLQETLARNQSPRRVALYTSNQVHVPTAIGLVKPAVVLPQWVIAELSSDELNQILLHELAHLARWDDWTNLAQKLVKAVFFFHPAVWWIENRVSLEREMACDDAVLAETASPRAYAECLAHLAEKTLIQRSVALAQAALGKIRQTSLRVAQILDANRPAGNGRAWKPAAAMVAAFAVICVVGISKTPRLIAFGDARVGAANPMVASISRDADDTRVSPGIMIHNLRASDAVSQSALVVPANLKMQGTSRRAESTRRAPATNAATAERRPADMVRLASANAAPAVFTETFFVVVQSGRNSSAQPVLQIQMWRLTVLHPVIDPNSNRIPPKKT
jgi:Zn-dependent protease with chaperone function